MLPEGVKERPFSRKLFALDNPPGYLVVLTGLATFRWSATLP
jgi:hypothetical protein